jgi:hypothetical protein
MISGPQSVTATSATQYQLTVTGGNSISYGTASTISGDTGWYDSGASTTVSSLWVWNTVSNQSRNAITNYAVDGSNLNPNQQGTGTLTTVSVTLSAAHTVAFASTTQYYLTVTGGSGVTYSFTSETLDNWFNSGDSVNVSSLWVWPIVSGQRAALNNYTVDAVPFTMGIRQYSGSFISATLPMTAYHAIAFLNTTQFSLTPSSDSNSAITPAALTWIDSGGSQVFNYSGNPGYLVQNVTVDGSNVTVTGSYTFPSVSASHTISVYAGVYLTNFTITISQWPTPNLNFTVTSPTLQNGTVILDLLGFSNPTYLLNQPYDLASDWNNSTGLLTLQVENGTTVIGYFGNLWGSFWITSVDSSITSLSWTGQAFTITTAGQGGVLSVYTGSRNEPQTYGGLTSEAYDQTTDILSGIYGPNGQIVLDWTVAPGLTNLTPTPQATLPPNSNPFSISSQNFGRALPGQKLTEILNLTVTESTEITSVTFSAPFNTWLKASTVLPQTFVIGKGEITFILTVPNGTVAKAYTGTVTVGWVDVYGNAMQSSAPISLTVGSAKNSTPNLSGVSPYLIYAVAGVIIFVVAAVAFSVAARKFNWF